MADPKRSLDIESALRWAFRDELPKTAERENPGEAPDFLAKPGYGWGAIESYAELLTKVDVNRYGVVPDIGYLSDPHPDAIMIGDAVRSLALCELMIPEGWNPLGDMPGLGMVGEAAVAKVLASDAVVTEAGTTRLRTSPSALVTKYAILGRYGCPEWEVDVPELKIVSANGKPKWFMQREQWSKSCDKRDVSHMVEVDGYNERAKRPYPGAYRKHILSPDPFLGILGRAEYEIWHAALSTLTEDLMPKLTSVALQPFTRAVRPWMDDVLPPSLVPSLDALAAPLNEFGGLR